jgi:hypothetical protein
MFKNIKNIPYIIEGYYKSLIRKEYQKYFGKDNIDDLLFKVSQCGDCYQNGNCIKCGCPMKEMLYSSKSCPNGKF